VQKNGLVKLKMIHSSCKYPSGYVGILAPPHYWLYYSLAQANSSPYCKQMQVTRMYHPLCQNHSLAVSIVRLIHLFFFFAWNPNK